MNARAIPLLLIALSAAAQPLTLEQAVRGALSRYPAIRASEEQTAAAAAGITLARTAYLPKIDALAQVNRATRNNVFGLMFPQSVVPSMSGPVVGTNNTGTVFGSALGGLVTWEPFDFGQRRAAVDFAAAGRAQSQAALQRTRFEVASSAADAYLTLAAAQETVRAAQAGVDRASTVARTIGALAAAQLRPGADRSRAEAELAAARTQLIQAEQAAAVARAGLAQFTGGEPAQLAISAGGLLRPAPESPAAPPDPARNPFLAEQNAMVEQARAQLRVLERSYFPRFYLQGAAYARGTGADVSGARLGGAGGLAPTVQNFALGLTVAFSVSDKPALQAREAAQSAAIRAQNARAEQVALELRTQWNRAAASLDGARRVAANTPVQVAAARAAAQQATARYQAGLGNIDEVAEAQRLLTQSEIDDALARLAVWRGLLGIAVAGGDIEPFLAEVAR
ncbi:MAG: TolC family protein [Acidobacteriota bacterium]|nr:TolC family protein [Acidobacteriota bacterium]